jgi:ketosteroid isomerase-like protein
MADIDELAATFEQAVTAINRRDLGAYSALWHDQIVAFPPFSPFAVEGKATLRQMAEANLANVESANLTPINPQCRVIGTTGLAWGHAALTLKPKDGPMRSVFIRYSWTFTKVDGQWREVLVHGSLLHSGN